MNTLHLHGALSKFGGPYKLDANTPRELVRALCVQLEDFEETIAAGIFRVTRVFQGTVLEIDEELVNLGMSDAELHIVPALTGSGKKGKGIGKLLLGIALVGVVIATGGTALAGVAGALGVSTGTITAFGAMLAFGGLSMLLAPSPKGPNPNDGEAEKASFIFNGAVNVSEQGHPVPLAYGRIMAGSVVISSDLVSDVYVPNSTNYNGSPVFYGYISTVNGGAGGTGSPPASMFPNYPNSFTGAGAIARNAVL